MVAVDCRSSVGLGAPPSLLLCKNDLFRGGWLWWYSGFVVEDFEADSPESLKSKSSPYQYPRRSVFSSSLVI
jgi:hypothetical protein